MEANELKTVIENAVKPALDETKSVKESVKGLEDRLSKIEALPLENKALNINKRASEYKGYKLSKQLANARNLASKSFEFTALNNDEKAEEFSKMMIDISKALRGDIQAKMDLNEFYRKTTLNEATSAQGAYLVPEEYSSDLMLLAKNSSFLLNVAKVVPMNSDTLRIPVELTRGTVTWETEGATKTASEPTFAECALTAKKMFAMAGANNEFLDDSEIDIAGLLTDQFTYSMGQEIDAQGFKGTGAPTSGIVLLAGYSVVLSTGASISTLSASDLSLAIAKLEEGYLAGARFFASRLAMHYIRTLKDTTGRFIYTDMAGSASKSIFEYPVNMTENLTSTDGASAGMILFGNFSKYVIGRRKLPMRIDIDPYSGFATDSTRFRLISRWGFGMGIANAFVVVKNSA